MQILNAAGKKLYLMFGYMEWSHFRLVEGTDVICHGSSSSIVSGFVFADVLDI